jgi:glutamate dehydrogenase/leucine dehydrogenase
LRCGSTILVRERGGDGDPVAAATRPATTRREANGGHERKEATVSVFEKMAEYGHEQVIFCYDRHTGTRAIIAIHDTALGPARGGTRYKHYPSEEAALDDVLRLARGMSYKFAFTDLPRGGGKAVVLADEPGRAGSGNEVDKHLRLRVYGRFVELLAGRFGTGPDLGVSARDVAEIGRSTRWAWASDERLGGSGDSAPVTALGVAAGIRVALEEVFGSPDLRGRRVVVQGLGGVGGHLAELLVSGGAHVLGADVAADRAKAAAERLGIELLDPEMAYDAECDVFSPNAVGGVLNEHTIPRLRCRIVAGGANNQLATPADGRRLAARAILYAPDYVINSAAPYAVIGKGELGYTDARLAAGAEEVAHSLKLIFRRARTEGRPTSAIADAIAEERIAVAARTRALASGEESAR